MERIIKPLLPLLITVLLPLQSWAISGPATDNDGNYTLHFSPNQMYKISEFKNGVFVKNFFYPPGQTLQITGRNNGTYRYDHWTRWTICVWEECDVIDNLEGSHTVVVDIPSIPPPMTPPSLSATHVSNSIALTWSASTGPNVTRYELERRAQGAWSRVYLGAARSFTDTVPGDGTYQYRVRAQNAQGWSAFSNPAQTVVAITPGVPASITVPATSDSGRYTVAWGSASGAVDRYELFQQAGGGGWLPVYAGTARTSSVSGLADGDYRYRVRACNVESTLTTCSAYKTSTVSTTAIRPGAPARIDVPPSDDNGTFPVSWASISAPLDRYELYQQTNGSQWGLVYAGSGTAKTVSGLGNGNYIFRVRACNVQGSVTHCGPYQTSGLVSVFVGGPGTGEIDPANDLMAEPEYNGLLKGEYTVSETGSFRYRLPLVIAPGINGMQPNLSLTYRSNRKNGLLGWGWRIGGLSAITRCKASVARDKAISGINSGDDYRFCLDGERLVEIASGEYRTEADDFARITRLGGTAKAPASWTVEYPNGEVLTYGATSDAVRYDNQAQPLTWSLNRRQDMAGNYLTYTYFHDAAQGIHRIQAIHYTRNDLATGTDNAVLFTYEDRDDVLETYRGGARYYVPQRLKTIETRAGGVNLTTYTLHYQRYGQRYFGKLFEDPLSTSHLAQIDLCYGYGAQCVEPLRFEWNDSESATFGMDTGTAHNRFPARTGDFDGDGLLEYFSTDVDSVNGDLTLSVTAIDPRDSDSAFPDVRFDHSYPVPSRVYDVNLDGRDDLVSFDFNEFAPTYRVVVYRSTGNGFVAETWADGLSELSSGWLFTARRFLRDINNDGLPDLHYYKIDHQNPAASKWYVKINTGSGFEPISLWLDNLTNYFVKLSDSPRHFGDFNGDGLTDLLICRYPNTTASTCHLDVLINTGQGFVSSGVWGSIADNSHHLRVGDVNGDGLTDVYHTLGGNEPGFVALSTGERFTPWQSWQANAQNGGLSPRRVFAHLNDDKCADLVTFGPKKGNGRYDTWVELSTCAGPQAGGQGFLPPANWLADAREKPILADFNHDGITDLSNIGHTGSGRTVNTVTRKRLRGVVDGLGDKVSVQYGPMTTSTHYTVTAATRTTSSFTHAGEGYEGNEEEEDAARLPVPTPRLIVEAVVDTRSAGDRKSLSYHYHNHRRDDSGWGALGFDTVAVTDTDSTGAVRKTVNHYHQRVDEAYALMGYPHRTLVYATDSTQSGNTLRLLSDKRFQWKVRLYRDDIDAGHKSPHYFPYLLETHEQSWDLVGTKGSQTTKNFTTTSFACSPVSTAVVTTLAGSSSDRDVSAYGVPLFSRQVFCDTVDGQAFISAVDTTYSDITGIDTTNRWVQGLVQRQRTQGWIGHPGSLASEVRTVAFRYNTLGQLSERVSEPDDSTNSPLRLKTQYNYNPYGTVNRTTQSWGAGAGPGLGFTSTVTRVDETYDAGGVRTVVQTDPAGLTQTTQYAAKFGLPLKHTDANGLVTDTVYDNLGRVDFIIHPDGTLTEYGFRACLGCFAYSGTAASYVQLKTTGQSAVRTYLDAEGREVGTRSRNLAGAFVYTRRDYNPQGQLSMRTAPFFATPSVDTRYAYDVLRRLTTTTFADTTTETIDYNGTQITTTNRLGQASVQQLTGGNLVVLSRDAAGTAVTYRYSPFGDLTSTTVDGNADTTVTIGYDRLGRKIRLDDPNTGVRVYTYNALGLLASETDAKNQVTRYHYDKRGRVTQRVDNATAAGVATRTHVWTYDNKPHGKGLLGSLVGFNTDGSSYAEHYTYTALSQLDRQQTAIDGQAFTFQWHYDGFSRPTGMTYPSGYRTIEDYNDHGFRHTVRAGGDGQVLWVANTADARGNLTRFTLGNGVVTDQHFEAIDGRLQAIQAHKGLFTIQDHGYQFDALGNLKQRSDHKHALTQHFCYDNLNRLTASRAGSCSASSSDFTYDALGNITQKTGVAGVYRYGQNGAGPHAVTSANHLQYTYDANGNMIAAKAGAQTVKSVAYTAFDKPSRISDTSPGSEKWSDVVYGPTKNRVKHSDSAGRTTIYASLGRYEVITKSGITRQVHYLGDFALYIGSAGSGEYRYKHRDHLGSLVAKSGEQATHANDVEWLANGPWGERRYQIWNGSLDEGYQPDDAARGFTGHEHLDSVSLIHMNGRVYDPQLGRFLSPDPLVQAPLNSQSYNRYSYVFNNPLSFVDPTGYASKILEQVDVVGYQFESKVKNAGSGWFRSGVKLYNYTNFNRSMGSVAGIIHPGFWLGRAATVDARVDTGVDASDDASGYDSDDGHGAKKRFIDPIKNYLDNNVTVTASGVLGVGAGIKGQAILDPTDIDGNSKVYGGAGGVLGVSATATIDFTLSKSGSFNDNQVVTKVGFTLGIGPALGVTVIASETGRQWALSVGAGVGISGSGVAGRQGSQSSMQGNPGAAAAARRREQRR
ncbi:hypothetical protein FKG94_27425 [Exilibacterium tricleocarpae]|uniref:Fibronectin type-III domain-containing protein n=1 Tax=Exilibacterium tricleocarpae TaxID=2591008 RepID=A0A545SMI0_9GAMM|nr:RHS repeat-associated core domain-containing protein [Exilibacterium tricleocarpae]TQV66157.1 hypothetical protein FKG94_27425 [Exilibacterium tricleocarpae]